MRGAILGLAGVLALLGAGSAKAEATIADFKTNKASKDMRLYISAMEQGFSWANADLGDGKRLYCVPGKLALTPDQMEDVLTRFLDEPKWEAVFKDTDPVGYAFLLAMRETFPCTTL